jgi:hypothetical protein
LPGPGGPLNCRAAKRKTELLRAVDLKFIEKLKQRIKNIKTQKIIVWRVGFTYPPPLKRVIFSFF